MEAFKATAVMLNEFGPRLVQVPVLPASGDLLTPYEERPANTVSEWEEPEELLTASESIAVPEWSVVIPLQLTPLFVVRLAG